MFCAGIERAIKAALAAHEGQTRKGDEETPYVTHPLHVALILARWGQASEVIQAGVLHDVVEDCDGWSVDRVRAEFGDDVAAIVDQLTEDKTRSWEERKRTGIEHVAHMTPAAAHVKAADKLHNLRSLVATLRDAPEREAVFARFNGGRDGTLRVARELVEALATRLAGEPAAALRAALAELERLA